MKKFLVTIMLMVIVASISTFPTAADEADGLRFDADGNIRYYTNGIAQYAGVVQDNVGNLYYINSGKIAVKNRVYDVTKTNGLVSPGRYYADENGHISPLNGLFHDPNGETRYYENGLATYAGLVYGDDGFMYYINSSCKAVKNREYFISRNNGIDSPSVLYFDRYGRAYFMEVNPGMAFYLIKDDSSPIGYVVIEKVMP